MRLSVLFEKCLYAKYLHSPNGGNYAIERIGSTLYIYLEHSDGGEDWKNNMNFPVIPYKRMGKTVWFAHRGFLKVWKSMEPYLASNILDPSLQNIITVGYSHGAALAVLCHEYIWYHRPDLRTVIEGYGFGCPRVLYGCASGEVAKRWERFYVVRNLDDLVTHLPPRAFGFRQVGRLIEIGKRGRWSRLDAHREENYILSLNSLSDEALTDLTKQYF